jgi:hypothetical protein
MLAQLVKVHFGDWVVVVGDSKAIQTIGHLLHLLALLVTNWEKLIPKLLKRLN